MKKQLIGLFVVGLFVVGLLFVCASEKDSEKEIVMHDISIKEKIKKEMQETVKLMGFELGIYGSTVRHTAGLPNKTYIMVKPDYSPDDSSSTIIVTPTSVELYTCSTPTPYHDWTRRRRIYYNSFVELEVALHDICFEELGFWSK